MPGPWSVIEDYEPMPQQLCALAFEGRPIVTRPAHDIEALRAEAERRNGAVWPEGCADCQERVR
jgi:hypothetical protein